MVDEKDRDPWTSQPGRAASRLGALLSITSAGCVVLDKTDDGSTCNSCPGTSSDPSSRTDTADTSDTGDTGGAGTQVAPFDVAVRSLLEEELEPFQRLARQSGDVQRAADCFESAARLGD